MKNRHTLARYSAGYLREWDGLEISPRRRGAVAASVERMIAGRARYDTVSQRTGVPWWVVAIIHKMECDLSFKKHLHNGDPLTKRTWQVPAGRPRVWGPDSTWEDSAVDAIRYDGLDKVQSWTIPTIAFALEKFNGFGYQIRGAPNPYLWSFTNRYVKGKFVADHTWDGSAVSQQSGGMALLKMMCERSPEVRDAVQAGVTNVPAPVDVDESERLPRADPKPLTQSRTVLSTVIAFFAWLLAKVAELFGFTAAVASEAAESASGWLDPIVRVAGFLGANVVPIATFLFIAGLAGVLAARISAQRNGKIG